MVLAAGGLVDVTDVQRITWKRKTSTDSRSSTATLADDSHIVFNLDADRVYQITLCAQSDSTSTTPDIKLAWAVGGGVAALTTRECYGPAVGTSAADQGSVRMTRHTLTTAVAYGLEGTTTNGSAIRETFLVETTTSGTSGTLTLQWAQNTSNATATRLTSATWATAVVLDDAA